MQPLLSSLQDWRRPVWILLLIASSIAFTLAFACAVPFAAFAAATALTLPKRDALVLMIGVWLANQITGFFFMDYPWDANAFAWSPALLITALVSMMAARITSKHIRHLHPLLCSALVFLAAFTGYEITCYVSSLMLGGEEVFTLKIQGPIFMLNALALTGLFAVNYVGLLLHLMPAYRLTASAQGHA